MKMILSALVLFSSISAFAETITNNPADTVRPGRIVKLVNLVEKDTIKVNVAVEDLGGSTDVSPTQNVYLTMYVKGEMFSTDASFNLGSVMSFTSAKRVGAGKYEVVVVNADLKTEKISINAADATVAIKNVKCDDFDCDASSNFATSIQVSRK